MGVYDYFADFGDFSYASIFNGLLTDYIRDSEDENKELFQVLAGLNRGIRLYRNFEVKINLESLANKKIGYRDVAKIAPGTIKAPYLLYWNDNENQKAVILNDKTCIETKGIYYCLTEPGSELEPFRKDILALTLNQPSDEELYKIIKQLLDGKAEAGGLQRQYDLATIGTVEEMKEKSVATAGKLFEDLQEKLSGIEHNQDKASFIQEVVGRVFLIKKAIYVRYMTSRSLLNERHGGNVVEQRKFAKSYVDEIRIVPYYNLFNGESQPKQE